MYKLYTKENCTDDKGVNIMVKRIAIISLIVLAIFASQVFAAVEYDSSGNASKITNSKGTVEYYSGGIVSKIVTPEGTATYNRNGTIDEIVGSPSISLEEANEMLLEAPSTGSSSPTTISTSSSNSSSKLPSTGVENSYLLAIPVVTVVACTLGYGIFRTERMIK